MARKRGRGGNPKYVGSCGIYVFVRAPGAGGSAQLLVHRRSRQVFQPNTVSSPGGIVERELCGPDGADFESGARTAAVRELHEETGVQLSLEMVDGLGLLPVGDGAHWGAAMHRNYFVVLPSHPDVTGPEKASKHELVPNGMDGIGCPAGDGYNAWVDVHELLGRDDLMPQCRVPLEHAVKTEPWASVDAGHAEGDCD
mmetsp:Transcript_78184/g.217113  ORF Transcript_78184/g.217113 Transcript_78184/m.217113 type:complete len:198 (+) Transcript_78184:144-737(+)